MTIVVLFGGVLSVPLKWWRMDEGIWSEMRPVLQGHPDGNCNVHSPRAMESVQQELRGSSCKRMSGFES